MQYLGSPGVYEFLMIGLGLFCQIVVLSSMIYLGYRYFKENEDEQAEMIRNS